MTFTGHTILITGGTSGIGLGFAKKFSELGNKVIITARNEKRLNQILNANCKMKLATLSQAKNI